MARPKGSKSTLPQGVAKLIKLARQAEENDPLAREAMGLLLSVMRGEVSGRYIGARLSAATLLLERARGKPEQKIKVEEQTTERRVLFADGTPLAPAAAGLPEDRPN